MGQPGPHGAVHSAQRPPSPASGTADPEAQNVSNRAENLLRTKNWTYPFFPLALLAILILLSSICVAISNSKNVPKFEDYPVKKVTTQRLKAVNLKSHPKARRYRTRLREAIGKSPNFAGHYVIASWGCGTNCQTVVLIDVNSGHVYFAAFGTAWGSEFRVDSYLFIDSPPANVPYPFPGIYYLWDEKSKTFRHLSRDAPH